MSIKGNVFAVAETKASALQNIRDTLSVDAEGNVSFKSNLGRGSGSPVKIPGESFEAFIELMQETASRREGVAQTVRNVNTTTVVSDTTEVTEVSE